MPELLSAPSRPAEPPALPAVSSPLPEPPSWAAITGARDPSQAPVPLGARIAGGVFLVNALIVVMGRVVMGATGSSLADNPIPAVIDVVIGGYLLANKARFLSWAKIRVVLGAVLFTGSQLFEGHLFLALFQLVFSLALLALLAGEPGRGRIGLGLAAVSACFALEGFGLYVEGSGRNPLARLFQPGRYEAGPVTLLTGRVFPYRMHCPAGWYSVRAAIAKRENPAVDVWISKPERDAHLYVIAEQLQPGARVDMDAFERVYLERAKARTASLEIAAAPRVPTGVENARFLHTRSKVGELEVESYTGLFAEADRIAQVVAFASRKQFAKVEPEFRELLADFTMPGPGATTLASASPR